MFAAYVNVVYPFRFAGEIEIEKVMGGMPSDPKVAEGWLRTKLGISKEQAA